MDTKVLEAIGLNPSQAKAYLYLVRSGKRTPTELAMDIQEARTNAYNLLDQLEKWGLAERVVEDKTYYRAANPNILKQLLVKRNQEINQTSSELATLLPSLLSTYRLVHDKPGIVHVEGAEAFKMIYDDVIRSGQEPLIFPSRHDRDDPETARIIDKQIERQRQAEIGSKVVVWKDSSVASQKESLATQKVTIAPALDQDLSAQIMVYGDNVAFTTFRNGISSTVLTNPEIAESMRAIFMQLWKQGAPQESASDTANGSEPPGSPPGSPPA